MSTRYIKPDIGSKSFVAAIGLVLFGLLLAVLVRLYQLQIVDPHLLERTFTEEIPALRGKIFDRNGDSVPLALSIPAQQVYVDPQDPKFTEGRHPVPKTRVAQTLATILGLPPDEMLATLQRKDNRYIPVAVTLDETIISNLVYAIGQRGKDQRLAGVRLTQTSVRSYPQGRRMSHVIGFATKGGEGLAGIEQVYDEVLKPIPGRIAGVRDSLARELRLRRMEDIDPIPGANVHLTLDHTIQNIAERELRAQVDKFKATAGFVIIQRVKTGEILALASCPDFDPNNYSREPPSSYLNKALTGVYEPGSTMKAVTVAAALNEGVITEHTRFDCMNAVWHYAGRPLNDHCRGMIDTRTALKKSSNIFCAKAAVALGPAKFEAYLRAFRFGSKLGIDLPGEAGGLLAPHKRWAMITPTRIGIGQGVAVTGLQMLNAYCTIANHGKMMQPYLVDRVVSPKGEVIKQNRPAVIGRPIKPAVADLVLDMLKGVLDDGGTARRARVKGYSVAGKTGTAQMVVRDVNPETGRVRSYYSNTDHHASFVGIIPASDPEIGILVVIERPQPQHTGGFVSAPVFARIAEEVMRYLSVPCDEKEDESRLD